MPKKKQNILGKIVHKDYNNELEKVIETKDFDEGIKSLLLAIFYKVDISYKDYKQVTRNSETKQQYIERLLKIIQENCKTIKIVKPNTKQAEELGKSSYLVDNKNKKIICYPIERNLLYSISKIGNQERIIKGKYYLVNKTISNIINTGNNIKTVEPIRDFNGWSWQISKKEIENIEYNLIYQNLRILVGDKFLNDWVLNTEYLIDYYDLLFDELTEKFGIKLKQKLISALEKLSILLEIERNPKYEKSLKGLQQHNIEELEKIENNQEYIEEKRKIEKIQDILKILEIEDKIEEKNKILEEFQKIFLQCFLVFINTAETKEEIINLIYTFRYYNFLPYDEDTEICTNKKLQKTLKQVNDELLKKAIDYKVITTLSKDIEENTKILQSIFKTKMMCIENIYISVEKENDKYYVEFSENNENSYEEKFEIKIPKKENLNIKLNKKIKIFN